MKEFEKYFETLDIPYNTHHEIEIEMVKTNMRIAWKAALEHIYYNVCPEAWDVGDVEFDIAQELGFGKEWLEQHD